MSRIGLVGAGLMGAGLARLFTRHGWPVSVYDTDAAALARVPDARRATSLADVAAEADFVIEAASERVEVKQAIFAELAAVSGAATVLATNSSVIPVGTITARLDDANAMRTIGMHFWNPPDIVPLVEVIAGPRSGAAALDAAMAMLALAGKEPIRVRRDTVPGNRMQHALWREAMALVEEGVCTPAEVDTVVKRSFGLRLAAIGPLENADLVGLVLTAQIHAVVFPTLNNATTPSPALADRIARGDIGVQSGAGFHSGWTDATIAALRTRVADHLANAVAGSGRAA